MTECSIVPTFLKHLIILGIVVGGFATALECNSKNSGTVGFIYGLFPGSFVYLLIVSLIYGGTTGAIGFGKTAIVGGILWVLFVMGTLFMLNVTKDNEKVTAAAFSLFVPSVALVASGIFLYRYLRSVDWIQTV